MITILIMTTLHPYFIDVLMPDLVGHERSPAAFVIYLYLWRRMEGRRAVQASYATIALDNGLSRITAQRAIALLLRRRLLSVESDSPTAVPKYTVLRPWIGRMPR